MILPGGNANLEVRLDKAIALEVGNHFTVREGGKAIGWGIVTEVIDYRQLET